ncbi:hypothetical protein CL656_01650 [bacterium]|nr:hypothetical protein [bacterium]|tara:strand:+ start:2124 stop:5117 length:2994 start_codon:yes stop_codon:yes gene_type:complete
METLNQHFDVFATKEKNKYDEKFEKIKEYIDNQNPWLCKNMCNDILSVLYKSERSQKKYCFKSLSYIIKTHNTQIVSMLTTLIPIVTIDINSTQKEVKDAAMKCLKQLLKCSNNSDLEPFTPVILESFTNPSSINTSVEKLASCVFVQNVEAPALAIVTPILIKGLNERKTETKRKACVIIDNMCKLVEHPKEIVHFGGLLESLIQKCTETISDPEAREVANKSLNTLRGALQGYNAEKCNTELTIESVQKIVDEKDVNFKVSNELLQVLQNMSELQFFDKQVWYENFKRYASGDFENMQQISEYVCESISKLYEVEEEVYEDTEEGQDLYKGSFSLAYGALTLLNNSHLHLKRNRFYGLLGPNNCGKTTLMRAIANEQVEGFPKRDELKTIFVEHEIQEREVGEDDKGFPILNIDLCGIDWVLDYCNVVCEMEPKVTSEQVETLMMDIGFGNSRQDFGKDRAADANMGVTTYSGGWKVKMQLCAATLMNADILMLDEPTGHLDTTNIAWIKNWLKNFISKGGSIIATSHDTSFLNEMCTHLIDFQNRKLKTFKGGTPGEVLKEFVDKYPEKVGYFELKNDIVKFKFPDPTPLDGVKSLSKSILKMKEVMYQYPSRDKPTIQNIALEVSRISRVAVIGANGAGKTTAIKVLIGELEPSEGTIYKHPNARIAYIAQHAFHHLEKHLNKTPTEYILQRFAGNEDKENVDFLHKKEKDIVKKTKYMIDPTNGVDLKECFGEDEEKKAVEVDKILGRRENKKEKIYEYDVKFKDKPIECNIWVRKEILINMGEESLVQRQDEKEAVAAGLMSRPLTSSSVEAYLKTFSIEAEQASHTLIKSLSGGQKVKVVLAASLWQNPHIVVLDEPTNYLDRDGLGALTLAINDFKGGVIIISHNKEFANAVSQEKWIMEKGNLRKEGESISKFEETNNKDANTIIGDDVMHDAYGNEIKVDKKKTLSDKEKKQAIKKIQKKIKEGKKKKTMTQEQIWDLEAELEELSK